MGALIAVAGCVGGNVDVTPVVKAMPDVQQFLKEHPNAEINAALWKEDTVSSNLGEIRTVCGNQMQIKDYWKVDVKEGDISIKIWLDGKTMEPLCAIKEGKNVLSNQTSINSTPTLDKPLNTTEKIKADNDPYSCNYGFIENDIDFSQYDALRGLFKTRIKNTGTMDLSIGRYQVWYDGVSTPMMWTVNNPTAYPIVKQGDRIVTVNVAGGTLNKIKFIGNICDGVTATAAKPTGGWRSATLSASDVLNATQQ